MASFVKLAKGAGQALRRMQEEMAAKAIEEKLVFPDAPGALQLYHGSPHAFDAFDFEANLRRGEGAMAFGPGGYMTGNRPLAEHYARGLSQRHRGGSGLGLASPFEQVVGGRKIAGNLGALNNYFLETLGNNLARDEMGNLVSMGARRKGRYSLSMDSNLDPYTGSVRADVMSGKYSGTRTKDFPPGVTDVDSFHNPHSTLSGMMKEDPIATLRYLQFKEAIRAMDRGMVDGLGNAGLKDTAASAGWPHYFAHSDDIALPEQLRMGVTAYGGRRIPKSSQGADWRLTPRTSDRAMEIGETLQGRLDPHMDLRLQVDRPRNPPVRRPEGGPAPWLYTADFGAGPNDMALYDMLLKDQSSRVQGALTELLLAKPHPSLDKLVDSYKDDLGAIPVSSIVRDAVPNDLSGMMMLKEAGIPATAFLRAGPRAGGVGLKFNPDDYNFVIHDQGKLSNVRREKIK